MTYLFELFCTMQRKLQFPDCVFKMFTKCCIVRVFISSISLYLFFFHLYIAFFHKEALKDPVMIQCITNWNNTTFFRNRLVSEKRIYCLLHLYTVVHGKTVVWESKPKSCCKKIQFCGLLMK